MSDTKKTSFIETAVLRQTEKGFMRKWFQAHPTEAVSRADVERIVKKPTNHATRILSDLIKEGTVVIAFDDKSKYTQKNVHYYRFSGVVYEPEPKPQQPQQKNNAEVKQLTLFPV
jgi:hypothetical protein